VTTASVNSAAATTVGTITSGVWNAGAVTSSGAVSAGTQVLAPSGALVGAPGFSWTGNTGTGIYRPAVDTVAIVTNSNERMRVLANGYVGIGTTIPLAELDVRGQMTMNFVIGNYIGLNAYYDNNWRNHIANASTGAYAFRQESDRLQILTSAGNATSGSVLGINERMCIQASTGNLGIGTTNPLAKLDVSGNIKLTGTIFNSSGRAVLNQSGSIINVVYADFSFTKSTTATGFIDSFTASITPSSTSSKILVTVSIKGLRNAGSAGNYVLVYLYRDTTTNLKMVGDDIGYAVPTATVQNINGLYLDSPNTAASVTYRLYANHTSASGITYIWRNGSITLMEVAG
jgi:hypothetical protein